MNERRRRRRCRWWRQAFGAAVMARWRWRRHAGAKRALTQGMCFCAIFFSVSVAIGFPVVMRLLGESMGGVNQAGCSCFRGFTRCSGRLGFQQWTNFARIADYYESLLKLGISYLIATSWWRNYLVHFFLCSGRFIPPEFISQQMCAIIFLLLQVDANICLEPWFVHFGMVNRWLHW